MTLSASRNRPPPGGITVRTRLLPWTPGIRPTWTVGQIRAVLREHEQGQLWRSAELLDAMGRDDRIPTVLNTRTRGLLGLPFKMAPSDEANADAVQFAADWEDLWPRFAPVSVLAKLLTDFVMMGVGLAQIYWEQVVDKEGNRVWEPRLQNEHSSYLHWSDTKQTYLYQTRDGIVPIETGTGKWVLLEAGERGYQNGAIRALALLWHIRSLTWGDWARYTERHGMPILKAKHPASIRSDARDAFWSDVVELGRETSLLLPQGVGPNNESFDVDLLEAKDGNWRAFEQLQARASSSIAIYLLGQNLTTEINPGQGSFAAAKVHGAVKSSIICADEVELGNDLFSQAVRPISSLLRKGGALIAPRPTWDTIPPVDRASMAKTQQIAASTLAVLNQSGYTIQNIEEYGAAYDMELVRVDGSAPPPPTEPSPSTPDEPGEDDDNEVVKASSIIPFKADGGEHLHTFSGATDGAHSHAFRMPDGAILVTEVGGEHFHSLDGETTEMDGEHSHEIILPDGTVAKTNDVVSAHSHNLRDDGEETITPGHHIHNYTMGDGTILTSLLVEEVRARSEVTFSTKDAEEGTDYNLRMSKQASRDMGVSLNKNFLSEIGGILQTASSYEEVRTRVLELYADRDPEEEAAILESVMRLAELNGDHSALVEVED